MRPTVLSCANLKHMFVKKNLDCAESLIRIYFNVRTI